MGARGRTIGIAVTVLAMAGLTACTAVEERPAFLAGEQTSRDELPATEDFAGIEPSSSRYLGADSYGHEYYAALRPIASGRDETCLIIAAGTNWASGCSADLPVWVGTDGVKATLYASDADVLGSGEAVGDHVRVTPDGS